MGQAGVLTDSFGTRYYTEAVLAPALGVSVKELGGLVASGYLPPPEIRFGSRKVWNEATVSRLLRESKAGGGWAPFH